VATGITKDGGNYTFRVAVPEGAGDAAIGDVVTQFGALGCLIEGYGFSRRRSSKALSCCVPPSGH
jgi:hypothetical protein